MVQKNFSIHDAQILTSDDGYVFDSFIITELNGELVRSERRRELETVLASVLLGEKLPSMSFANNRQLQHFTVKTDVRFLKESKKRAYGVRNRCFRQTRFIGSNQSNFYRVKTQSL